MYTHELLKARLTSCRMSDHCVKFKDECTDMCYN